ncbi:hypothetical protein [Rhizorhapis suberifaciens]|uniref:Porin domain-containing protein n=1 Tax=Rhizorhapis suberifaciens TaxID=13656 RepID=A0A840HSS4_9SPHN|nr:hypothetical protein [Rhizorhapis suberifaciens]MBB4640761.1 hypothetical protein [Rhizorhapis suberifaciens]
MRVRRGHMLWSGAAFAVAALALSPAFGAVAGLMRASKEAPNVSLSKLGGIGSFTPTNGDPRLVSNYAKAALNSSRGFRFTPTSGSMSGTRSITIAVRANGSLQDRGIPSILSITPVAYNLGVSRGWKKFATPEFVGKLDLPPVAVETGSGKIDGADGFSLSGKRKFSTSVQLDSERPIATSPQTLAGEEAISVDLAGSYSLTRNLDLKAGVRYRGPMNRLAPLTDDRQDSQAVYIGTAFKF